jgi:hypothetical protein
LHQQTFGPTHSPLLPQEEEHTVGEQNRRGVGNQLIFSLGALNLIKCYLVILLCFRCLENPNKNKIGLRMELTRHLGARLELQVAEGMCLWKYHTASLLNAYLCKPLSIPGPTAGTTPPELAPVCNGVLSCVDAKCANFCAPK